MKGFLHVKKYIVLFSLVISYSVVEADSFEVVEEDKRVLIPYELKNIWDTQHGWTAYGLSRYSIELTGEANSSCKIKSHESKYQWIPVVGKNAWYIPYRYWAENGDKKIVYQVAKSWNSNTNVGELWFKGEIECIRKPRSNNISVHLWRINVEHETTLDVNIHVPSPANLAIVSTNDFQNIKLRNRECYSNDIFSNLPSEVQAKLRVMPANTNGIFITSIENLNGETLNKNSKLKICGLENAGKGYERISIELKIP